MTSNPIIKCSHLPCRCSVETDEPYCSEACADAKDMPQIQCPCGHPECVGMEEAAEGDEFHLPAAKG